MYAYANGDTRWTDPTTMHIAESSFPSPHLHEQSAVQNVTCYKVAAEKEQPERQLFPFSAKTGNLVDGIRLLRGELNERKVPQPSNLMPQNVKLPADWRTRPGPAVQFHNLYSPSIGQFHSSVSYNPSFPTLSHLESFHSPSSFSPPFQIGTILPRMTSFGSNRPEYGNKLGDAVNNFNEPMCETKPPTPPPRTTSLRLNRPCYECVYSDRINDVEKVKSEISSRFKRRGHENEQEDEKEVADGQKKRGLKGKFKYETTRLLNEWLSAHLSDPYPTRVEKKVLSNLVGISITQVGNYVAQGDRKYVVYVSPEFWTVFIGVNGDDLLNIKKSLE
nr:TALE class homeobox transcription factor Meis [Hymenolepis microstoma]